MQRFSILLVAHRRMAHFNWQWWGPLRQRLAADKPHHTIYVASDAGLELALSRPLKYRAWRSV